MSDQSSQREQKHLRQTRRAFYLSAIGGESDFTLCDVLCEFAGVEMQDPFETATSQDDGINQGSEGVNE